MTAAPVVYEEHVGRSRQYWRDLVLGINDGLVSMLLLVVGVVGGGLDRQQIVLTGVAGALAGAVSMATGEYLATKSQDEVMESELALERTHIKHFRQQEVDQLYPMLREVGVSESDIDSVVKALTRDDEVLLNSMKVLEFGVVDTERRSPMSAAWASGGLFLLGSIPAVVPFLFPISRTTGVVVAAITAGLCLFAVGVVKTFVTRTNAFAAGFQNLIIAGVGALAAFGVGRLVGVTPLA
ncbi:MAG TPA: VIT1/CCC1 transporter family protein [Acidimicrobiia bacterium]|nr:VIT1/CCC1 transporter family protein [Acidimicrobiia bacterium]